MPAYAADKTWNGVQGNWYDANSWLPVGVPVSGDNVTLANANAVLALENETAALASFSMTAGSLVFSNWNTCLRAENVQISGGTVTVANAFDDDAMSNRVWIAGSGDFALTRPGIINVDFLGYAPECGPGIIWPVRNNDYGAGGGHGGRGGHGAYLGSITNDSLTDPEIPGAGGGRLLYGAFGGGAVRLDFGGTVDLRGIITAKGGNGASYGGGAAGGAILIKSAFFTGNADGLLRASGGNGTTLVGPGGGGRISVQSALVSPMPVVFEANRGAGGRDAAETYDIRYGFAAEPGTLYLTDTNIFSSLPMNNRMSNVVLFVADRAEWSVPSLTMSNSLFRFGATNFVLNVAGDIMIGPTGFLGVAGTVNCGGNLTLTNNGSLALFSGPTNALSPEYGALLDVAGDVTIGGNKSWILTHSDAVNGGAPLLRMSNLFITATGTNGGINASGRGYAMCQGPGRGGGDSGYSGGGGYGGLGGNRGASVPGGLTYGSSNMPIHSGSGGGYTNGGGYGGGVVNIRSSGDVFLNGSLAANGAKGCWAYLWNAGGGAGGSVLVSCNRFVGTTNSILTATGGDAGLPGESAGGGGRIAVWTTESAIHIFQNRIVPVRYIWKRNHPDFLGSVYLNGGKGRAYGDKNEADSGSSGFYRMENSMVLTVY